ncbi:AI-2E family transporter [Paenarthrobacter sp. AMU7]|uniref:AI-2E family transporter n=1 Tax=Paenarthrobacter sp. AMU7 TaxID=3162492 RepID=A0AB39YQK6_9MICC
MESVPSRSSTLPRAGAILLSLAGAVIVLGGLKAAADIAAPMLLALVISLALAPLRGRLLSLGAPGWLATTATLFVLVLVFLGLGWAFFLMATQLTEILPGYEKQFSSLVASLTAALESAGLTEGAVEALRGSVQFGHITAFVLEILGGAAAILSNLVFLISLLLFMSLDTPGFSNGFRRLGPQHARIVEPMRTFARGTRKYLAVCTGFGAVVALLDVGLLYLLDIPLPWLWGLLAFITNFIPNVGFLIGLMPPALLGLLEGGPARMIILVVIYCVINVLIQTIIQPQVVNNAVGLNNTASFLSLVLWTWILGPIGAILAVPMTLLFIAVLAGNDPRNKWTTILYAPDTGPKKTIQNQTPEELTHEG